MEARKRVLGDVTHFAEKSVKAVAEGSQLGAIAVSGVPELSAAGISWDSASFGFGSMLDCLGAVGALRLAGCRFIAISF
jgi:hypothetical protein